MLTRDRILTIYDLEVELTWTGKNADGEEATGTLKVPEVSHEAIDGLSDYVVRLPPSSFLGAYLSRPA